MTAAALFYIFYTIPELRDDGSQRYAHHIPVYNVLYSIHAGSQDPHCCIYAHMMMFVTIDDAFRLILRGVSSSHHVSLLGDMQHRHRVMQWMLL